MTSDTGAIKGAVIRGAGRERREVRQRRLGMSNKRMMQKHRQKQSSAAARNAALEFGSDVRGEDNDRSSDDGALLLHEYSGDNSAEGLLLHEDSADNSAEGMMPFPYEHLFSGDGHPTVSPGEGGPTSPTFPSHVNPPSGPSAPSVNSPSLPSVNAPAMPSAPSVNTPSLPSAPSVNAPSLPSAPSVNAPSLPSAPSVNAPSLPSAPSVNAPIGPTRPTQWPPNYPPSFFAPLPTPRPTNANARPSAVQPTAPVYVRPTGQGPPTTRRPTQTPTESPRPTQSSEPTQTPALTQTRSPTLRPTFPGGSFTAAPTLPLATPSPTTQPVAVTEAPTVTQITTAPTSNAATSDPLPGLPTKPPGTAPPVSLPPTDDTCKADAEGNFGFPTAPIVEFIAYRYQAQVTSEVTAEELDNTILQRVEISISDVLVPNLFFEEGECEITSLVAQGRVRTSGGLGLGLEIKGTAHGLSEVERKRAQHWAMPDHNEHEQSRQPDLDQGGVRKDPLGLHRRHLLLGADSRFLQEDVFRPDDLVGLTAAPPDRILRGRLQNACPFPVPGNGPDGQPLVCYVIEGTVSVFGFGDLSWVDPIVQESLDEAMGAGEFDNGVVDDSLIFARLIPPGTTLNTTTDGSEGENKSGGGGGGTPAWAWVLIAFGIFGLLLSLIYLTIKRKKQQDEFDQMKEEAEFFTGENASKEGNEEDGEGDDEGDDEDRDRVEIYGDDDDSDDVNVAGLEDGASDDDEYTDGQLQMSAGSFRASGSARSGGSFRASGSARSGSDGDVIEA